MAENQFEQEGKQLYAALIQALTNARNGNNSYLPFIRHHLPKRQNAPEKPVQVLVIGGTMYKSAEVFGSGPAISIRSKTEGRLPILADKQTFLNFMLPLLLPSCDIVAISFAYPLQPIFVKNILDGTLLYPSKEHAFTGLIGEQIGAVLQQAVLETTGRAITVSVANDGICLLLSGLTQYPWQELGAAIVGTGIGAALFLSETEAVNLEPGNFDNFVLSPTDRAVDAQSQQPGAALFEKAASGKYLWQQYNALAHEYHLSPAHVSQTETVSELAASNTGLAGDTARMLLLRSSWFAAALCAAISSFNTKPSTMVMQGSLFWKGFGYKQLVEEHVAALLGPERHIAFVQINNADIIGAAQLVR